MFRKFALSKAYGRDTLIDSQTARALLQSLSEPVKHKRTSRTRTQLRDIIVTAHDTGMPISIIVSILCVKSSVAAMKQMAYVAVAKHRRKAQDLIFLCN